MYCMYFFLDQTEDDDSGVPAVTGTAAVTGTPAVDILSQSEHL